MELAEAASEPSARPAAAWRSRLPRLLVCGWGDAPAMDPAAWRHDRAEVVHERLPSDARAAYAGLRARVLEHGAAGVLLVETHGRGPGLRVALGAGNRRVGSAAGLGAGAPPRERRITPLGPGSARATAPVADMLRALAAHGLAAAPSPEPSEERGNYLLYRLLTEVASTSGAPTVGALALPTESADMHDRAVRAAVLAFADTLAPARLPAIDR